MRIRYFVLTCAILLLLLFGGAGARGGEPVRFGSATAIIPSNLTRTRGAAPVGDLEKLLGAPGAASRMGDLYTVVLQFRTLPTASMRARLSALGVQLEDYLGGNAYFALAPGGLAAAKLSALGAVGVCAMKPEWKLEGFVARGGIPDYARATSGGVRLRAYYSGVATKGDVERALRALGVERFRVSPGSNSVSLTLPRGIAAREVATLPFVKSVFAAAAPAKLGNVEGFVVAHGDRLVANASGLSLEGKGVNVGLWDGNVELHTDLGARVHRQEFEMGVQMSQGHGMHVAGTIAGSGRIDPRGRGMAPGVELYTYNFSRQHNGKTVAEELLEAKEKYRVSLTNHSYGPDLNEFCARYDQLAYNATSKDLDIDRFCYEQPSVTQVYAVGNEQGACGREYGSSMNRQKNVIHVGATKGDGSITAFTSYGPTDDGRLIPTVSAVGYKVYSTMPNDGYGYMSGTSMACPTVTGLLALVTEHYKGKKNGEIPHSAFLRGLLAVTAEDMGRPGPDYQYGYGSVNAEAAVALIDAGTYRKAKLQAGANPLEFPITVSKGGGELRVMLVWNDPTSSKVPAYGESVLINDLDLSLTTAEGKTVLPWVLDPSRPAEKAKPQVDRLNNIEQVTLPEPQAGEVTVRVSLARVATAEQEFFVLWYFAPKPEGVRYPDAHAKFAPGDTVNMQFAGLYPVGEKQVELSLDGGASYTYIGTFRGQESGRIALPGDLGMSHRAKLRISDAQGRVIATPGEFSVLPVPTRLAVEGRVCEPNSVRLSWQGVKGCTGYRVLTLVSGKEEFELVREIADPNTTSLDIPVKYLPVGSSTLLTVEAYTVLPSGAKVLSQRAKGKMYTNVLPLELGDGDLPFVQDLQRYPSTYFAVYLGKNLLFNYEELWASRGKPGDHLVVVTPGKNAKSWNKNDPFASADNVIKLKSCELDLTKMSGRLELRINLDWTAKEEGNAAFRVLANGGPLKDIHGKSLLLAPKDDVQNLILAYDLSSYVGGKVQLELQGALAKANQDLLSISNISLNRPVTKPDVEVKAMVYPAAGDVPRTASDAVRIVLQNLSSETLHDVPLKVTVDGGEKLSESISELRPLEITRYDFTGKIDLSTTNPEGQRFQVKVECTVAGDPNTKNNAVEREVINYGPVLRMPRSVVETSILGKSVSTPREVEVIGDKRVFTDAGGLIEGAPSYPQQEAVMQFVPKTDGKVIRLIFEELELPSKSFLRIWTSDLDLGNVYNSEPDWVVTPETQLPLEFVAGGKQGRLTVWYHSEKNISASGWKASVAEEARENTYTLEPFAVDQVYPDGLLPLEVKVQNNSSAEKRDVELRYRVNAGEWHSETIPSIGAGSTASYAFKTKPSIPLGNSYTVDVEVVSPDADLSDNAQHASFLNDNYCRGAVSNTTVMYFRSVGVGKERIATRANTSEGIGYYTAPALEAYKSSGVVPLVLETNDLSTMLSKDRYRIAVFVDWNGNNAFEPQEQQPLIALQAEGNVYEELLKIPSDAQLGTHRMRVMIGFTTELKACDASLSRGDIKDFTLELKEHYPIALDVEVVDTDVHSGVNLKNMPLTVTIRNNGEKPAKNVKLIYILNEQQVQEELPGELAPFQVRKYQFNELMHTATTNMYQIAVGAKAAGDVNEKNDVMQNIFFNSTPPQGQYCVHPSSLVAVEELVALGSVGHADMDKAGTIETWVKVENRGLNKLISGKGMSLAIVGDQFEGAAKMRNGVLLFIGNKVFISPSDVIELGKWYHLAVSYHVVEALGLRDAELKLYLNGEEQELKIGTAYGAPSGTANQTLSVAYRIDGAIDMLRVWTKERSGVEIARDMRVSVRDQSTQALPEGCAAEYTFDEGVGNYASLSGTLPAAVLSKRIAQADGIWQPINDMLLGIEGESILTTTKVSPYEFVVELAKGADSKRVQLLLEGTWPKTSFTHDGNLIEPTTRLDLSKGPITIKAKTDLFGEAITAEIKVSPQENYSDACELLSFGFKRESNVGLLADARIGVAKGKDVLELTVKGDLDLENLVPAFELSAGATLMIGEETLESDRNSAAFSGERLLVVHAQSRRARKSYVVRVHYEKVERQPVRILVRSNGAPLENAEVYLGKEKLGRTGKNGTIASSLFLGEQELRVEVKGYPPFTQKVRVEASTKEIALDVPSPSISLHFVVLAGGSAVEGASVEAGGKTGRTDAKGKYVAELPMKDKGSYSYTVRHADYTSYTSSVKGSSSRSVTVNLQPKGITAVADGRAAHITLAPNPCRDGVVVALDTPQGITLYDAQGHLIETIAAGSRRVWVDMKARPAGVYFVRVGHTTKPIVKQ